MDLRDHDTAMTALEEKAGSVAETLKLLANQKRLLILCRLAVAGELPASALAEAVSLSQSALSQHLAKLREQGLVGYRRDSQTLFYSIADPQVEQFLGALKDIYCPEIS